MNKLMDEWESHFEEAVWVVWRARALPLASAVSPAVSPASLSSREGVPAAGTSPLRAPCSTSVKSVQYATS